MTEKIPDFDFSRSLLLFLGGDAPPAFYAAAGLQTAAACICADSGAAHALALGCTPDIVIGDMDSLPKDTLTRLQNMHIPMQTFPTKKDLTDGELALQKAIELAKAKELDIAVFGSLGDRPDHSLANLFIGRQAARQGITIRYFYAKAVGHLLQGPGETLLKPQNGQTVSIISLTESTKGITLQGFEYPLANFELRAEYALGISNVLTDSQGSIQCTDGCLYIVQNFDS